MKIISEDAFLSRILYEDPPRQELLKLTTDKKIFQKIEAVIELNSNLAKFENDQKFPEKYAEALFAKLKYLSDSPDVKAMLLTELHNYHLKHGYFSEATAAHLSAAALISEYLTFLGKIDRSVFRNIRHPANLFLDACPAAISEIIPETFTNEIDKLDINGYCTSQYFSELVLLIIIKEARETSQRGKLFEITCKIYNLMSSLAQYRQLWGLLQNECVNASIA